MTYWSGYDTRPIGGGNPYYCCVGCGRSDPEINGDIEKHGEGCSEVAKLRARTPTVLAALPDVQAMIAAAYERASAETLTLVLASVTDIASTLLSVGDDAGANALCVLIKTLEQHNSAIPKSVSEALTPADATAALAARDAAMIARGMREAATLLREQGYGTAPKQILARAAEIEGDSK